MNKGTNEAADRYSACNCIKLQQRRADREKRPAQKTDTSLDQYKELLSETKQGYGL